jgi:hypothetical protein
LAGNWEVSQSLDYRDGLRDCNIVISVPLTERNQRAKRTTIENEFQLDKFQVDKICGYLFVGDSHTHMLYLHSIPCQRIVESVFKIYEIWDLMQDEIKKYVIKEGTIPGNTSLH